jgi:hypothetical protein
MNIPTIKVLKMIPLYFNVYEIGRRYVDPITKQIVYSVIDQLGVQDYFDKSYYIHNSRTAVSVNNDESGNMRMGDRRVDVEVDIHLNPDNGQLWQMATPGNRLVYGTAQRWQHAYEKIWCDPTICCCINEHTVPYSVILNFELTFKEYDKAQSKDGYVARLDYKGSNAEPGSFGIHVQYFDQPINCWLSPTTDANVFSENGGYEGWNVGFDYTLAKNILLDVNYYDTEAKIGKDEEKLFYADVYFMF